MNTSIVAVGAAATTLIALMWAVNHRRDLNALAEQVPHKGLAHHAATPALAHAIAQPPPANPALTHPLVSSSDHHGHLEAISRGAAEHHELLQGLLDQVWAHEIRES